MRRKLVSGRSRCVFEVRADGLVGFRWRWDFHGGGSRRYRTEVGDTDWFILLFDRRVGATVQSSGRIDLICGVFAIFRCCEGGFFGGRGIRDGLSLPKQDHVASVERLRGD